MNEKTKKTINEIKQEIDALHNQSDFSDIGDAIGRVIGSNEDGVLGFEADDFVSGFNHGVSIANGTHNKT